MKTTPICFMVMPFGVKEVVPPVGGAPTSIDFDLLWDKALCPAIVELGYDPVRADQDTSAGIILEMLERLYFSDVVVADMTIPNGNVYYEIGIRHACHRQGCVLVSAEWAIPLFDLNQMRRITYPLTSPVCDEVGAADIRKAILAGAHELLKGDSPMYQSIPGYPDPAKIGPNRGATFRAQMHKFADFQAAVRAARRAVLPAQRREMALVISENFPVERPMSKSISLELMSLLRDCVGWREMLDFVDAMPPDFGALEIVREQAILARSKLGSHLEAIGALEELNMRFGETSERWGLLGGRLKALADEMREAGDDFSYKTYLGRAIDAYEKGMKCNLNDFYPSSNLPALYRERGNEGDASKSELAAQIARLACERDTQNPWAKPTLLTLAFYSQDLTLAQEYARAVREEGAAIWQLDSTIDTLRRLVEYCFDDGKRRALGNVLVELRAQIPQPEPQ